MTVGGPAVPGSQDPLLGKVLSERYRILKKLGEGGMGVVYLAEHVVIEKKIALKVLFPDLTRRTDLVQRFMQEAKSASRIGHENVIDITDFGQSPEGYVFIAMEYLVGQDLGQILKASGPMPWSRAQPILVQIVKALRAAHERGIVHRDMKPENIFILPRDDGREFVKVLDFGIAKVLGLDEDAPRLTRTGMIFGTPEYMSPEQAQGQSVDHRVDIYAVGCIMYHLLTGEVPFKAESFMGILSKHMIEPPTPPRERNPHIDPSVEAVVLRAMEKDPNNRYQTMRDFVTALAPLGTMPDMSGAIYAATGLPVPLAANTREPTAPVARVSSVPSSRVPTGAPARAGTAGPLPHATREVPGRGSIPLAAANPEVRRSRTAVFERQLDEGPPVRAKARSGSTTVMAVGVGVVVLAGVLVLVLRGRSGDASAGHSAGPASAAAGVVPTAPGTTAPAGAAPGGSVDVTNARVVAGATPTAAPGAEPGPKADLAKTETKTETKTDTKTDTKKSAAAGRHHRSSREAVEALMPGEAPSQAPAPRAKPGTATPAELKNPFSTSPQ